MKPTELPERIELQIVASFLEPTYYTLVTHLLAGGYIQAQKSGGSVNFTPIPPPEPSDEEVVLGVVEYKDKNDSSNKTHYLLIFASGIHAGKGMIIPLEELLPTTHGLKIENGFAVVNTKSVKKYIQSVKVNTRFRPS